MKKSEEDLTLPVGYIVKNIGYWALIKHQMNDKVVYKCKAATEAGARRESKLFLSGALTKMPAATAKKQTYVRRTTKKK